MAGDACEPVILEEAGAFVADMLVATTRDDEDNLVISLLRLTHAGVNLVETVIGPRSKAVDHPLGDVRLPSGTVVAAVIRAGVPVVPDSAFVLRPGDEVLVVARPALQQDIAHIFR